MHVKFVLYSDDLLMNTISKLQPQQTRSPVELEVTLKGIVLVFN